MKLYLILSDDTVPCEITAEDIYEAIIKFAEYVGDKTELFEVAMKGVATVEEGIRMFNHFSSYTMTDIYGIACHYKKDTEVDE